MYEIKRGGHADMKRIYPMLEHDFHEWERPSLADCHLGLIRGAWSDWSLMKPVNQLLHGVSRPDDLCLNFVAYRHHQKSS